MQSDRKGDFSTLACGRYSALPNESSFRGARRARADRQEMQPCPCWPSGWVKAHLVSNKSEGTFLNRGEFRRPRRPLSSFIVIGIFFFWKREGKQGPCVEPGPSLLISN